LLLLSFKAKNRMVRSLELEPVIVTRGLHRDRFGLPMLEQLAFRNLQAELTIFETALNLCCEYFF